MVKVEDVKGSMGTIRRGYILEGGHRKTGLGTELRGGYLG